MPVHRISIQIYYSFKLADTMIKPLSDPATDYDDVDGKLFAIRGVYDVRLDFLETNCSKVLLLIVLFN